MHLLMHLCERKKNSLHIFEIININFWQIWNFDVKGTGWLGLQLSIIFKQTVGRFDMRVKNFIDLSTLEIY